MEAVKPTHVRLGLIKVASADLDPTANMWQSYIGF